MGFPEEKWNRTGFRFLSRTTGAGFFGDESTFGTSFQYVFHPSLGGDPIFFLIDPSDTPAMDGHQPQKTKNQN
jgi:hypothetical protein